MACFGTPFLVCFAGFAAAVLLLMGQSEFTKYLGLRFLPPIKRSPPQGFLNAFTILQGQSHG